eukprot:COSAG02_NODE_1371_length_13018_cov_6.783265_5_plen_48_part_00
MLYSLYTVFTMHIVQPCTTCAHEEELVANLRWVREACERGRGVPREG